MKPLKVVIISNVIFPRISPRSNRATELAKELGRLGHDVTLYGVLGKYDYKSFCEKYNVKVKQLGTNVFSNFNSESPPNFKEFMCTRVLRKIFGKIFEFPDIYLSRMVYNTLKKENNIDLLISIAIPYPIHWGVALFRTLNNKSRKIKTWVADCGDPYMGNTFSEKKAFYFKYVEKWFCKKVDYLTVPIDEAKQAYYPEFFKKIVTIPQGFNFEEVNLDGNYKGNSVPTFVYAGIFYPQKRDPKLLLDFLIEYDKDFRFIVYTKSQSLLASYKKILKNRLIIKDYIPRHELLIVMSKADFVLNLENATILQSPSKLIDYGLSNRPILSINTNKNLDKKLILEFLEGDYSRAFKIDDFERYNIKNVVSGFLNLHYKNLANKLNKSNRE